MARWKSGGPLEGSSRSLNAHPQEEYRIADIWFVEVEI